MFENLMYRVGVKVAHTAININKRFARMLHESATRRALSGDTAGATAAHKAAAHLDRVNQQAVADLAAC